MLIVHTMNISTVTTKKRPSNELQNSKVFSLALKYDTAFNVTLFPFDGLAYPHVPNNQKQNN